MMYGSDQRDVKEDGEAEKYREVEEVEISDKCNHYKCV